MSRYIGLVRAAYPRIKSANPRAIVIAGVAGPRGGSGNGNVGARTWLQRIVRARGVRFDAYSQHIYPSAAPRALTRAFPSWSSIAEILRTLDQRRPGINVNWPGGLIFANGRRKPSFASFRALARRPFTADQRRELRR